MKRVFIYYTVAALIIIILIPTIIVTAFDFVPRNKEIKKAVVDSKDSSEKTGDIDIENGIEVYDTRTQKVKKMDLEEYVKGVVAAEMPAEFHIEALKAQAIASRTYALSRVENYKDGHPDHKEAALCTGIHCQAYLTLEELINIHAKDWEEKYWTKIGEAVDATKDQVLYYKGELIEPLYHSTSGGMTENSQDVFAVDKPYLKSVSSPHEEEAPKFKDLVTLTGDEFIKKLTSKYPNADITKENLGEKIKLVEKSESGRIKKIAIDGTVINGGEIRELLELNSTNFTITYNPKNNIVEIETIGYGHGVGMSQWGANGMAKEGKSYEKILKHYYTGIKIQNYLSKNGQGDGPFVQKGLKAEE